ncbi:hypothetical protein [Streptomyces sp. NPDC057386]|uniref:hypothetical protein n=1 Tax=unclassified Streptomyces TaxID=2593676 RepID=UPI003637B651
MRNQPIPDDLVRTQVEWMCAYQALAHGEGSYAALRRRLVTLSARVDAHPYWEGRTPPAGARAQVRRLARERVSPPAGFRS